jgi:hypothetical protein
MIKSGCDKNEMKDQPTLFETPTEAVKVEKILLYALGEFQSRGKLLAGRELALDRLRGAFKRACEKFGVAELPDEKIAESLERLEAKVKRVPSFVAKHPFRVTVASDLADRARLFYVEQEEEEKSAV